MKIPKTREELENELALKDALEKERDESDRKYAIKLIEKIVFGAIGMIAVGFLGYLISLAFK